MDNPKIMGSIDDRDFSKLSFEEKNKKFIEQCGKPYVEPTKEEANAIRKKYGLPPLD